MGIFLSSVYDGLRSGWRCMDGMFIRGGLRRKMGRIKFFE